MSQPHDPIYDNQLSLKAAYMRLFSSDDGKAVLRDIEEQGFYNDPTYNGDVNKTLFNEGARNLMLRIRDLALSPLPDAKDN